MDTAAKTDSDALTLRSARQRGHGLIAKSKFEAVRALFDGLARLPLTQSIRPSDIGMIMVRGRVGGVGARFNLGELPVARAALRIAGGAVGIGYVAGRSIDHAELAALGDAMLQDAQWRDDLETQVLLPLAAAMAERKHLTARQAAATKVDFFTMTRTRAEP